MYVVKNMENLKYLSPYNYGSHWVELENAQRFNIETSKEKVEDLVDKVWIMDVNVSLVKVEVNIDVKEIVEMERNKIEVKDFILTKDEFIELKKDLKALRKTTYNKFGTKERKMSIVHHIVLNLLKNNYYLKGIELGKRRFFLTHGEILNAKKIILKTKNLRYELRNVFPSIKEDKMVLIQERLREDIQG